MDRKTLTMILAAVLIGGFFLPYFKMGPFTISGFDFIKAKGGRLGQIPDAGYSSCSCIVACRCIEQ